MVKSKITKAKKGYTYDLTLKGLTQGELLSIRNAMKKHAEVSPVDVSGYIEHAVTESGAFDPDQ